MASGCAVEEQIAFDQRSLQPALPVEVFDNRFSNSVGEAEGAYFAKQAREFRNFLSVDETARLLEAGHPLADIQTMLGQRMIARTVEFHAMLIYDATKLEAPVPKTADEAWRPPREIVVDVIAGVYFASEQRRLADAAEVLNRGIPRSGRLQRLTASEIRNALHAFVRPGIANVEAQQLRAEQVANRAAVLWRLWKRIEATPELARQPKSVAFVMIVDDGRLYAWLLEIEETASRPKLSEQHRSRLLTDGIHL